MEVHILNLDPKYTYNVNINPTNKDNREITIQLMDLKNPTSGDGSDTNPFVVSLGAYRSSHTSVGSSGVVNYSFTPTEAGTYVFESMAQVGNLAVNKMDPVFYYDSQVKAGGIGTNFKKELVCEANVTYNFKLFLSDASGLKTTASETNPAKFDFTILKK